MRRVLILIVATFLVGYDALAVAPVFWRVTGADEFLAGEIEGFAVTSRGELRLAPSMKKVASFTDPFVLSQTVTPSGDRYFGTGNDGRVYRLRGEQLEVVYTAAEPEIYALAWFDGSLIAASSPNGKVYRIDPQAKTATVLFDPEQAYIWALEPSGSELLVATGVEGKLFRVSASGEGKLLYDAPDTHLRSLAVRRDGTILAGASAKGRIYQIAKDGAAIALFDSPLSEISAIHVDASGTAWAAGVSNVLPSSAPKSQAKPAQQQQQQQQQSGTTSSSGDASAQESAPTVEVSFSFDDPAAAAAQSGTSEVYRIDPDGFVQTVRKFEREMVYAISSSDDGGILVGTGPNGRVYRVHDGELALVGSVPEKQVVSISGSGDASVITTTNTGAVYRLQRGASGDAEYRSAPKDAERFSRFGNYRIEGRNLAVGTVSMSFRSGNTKTPDDTWSDWSAASAALEGDIKVPPARYVQWRLRMPEPRPDASIDTVTVAYMNRNIAPSIDAVAVQDPAVVYITSNYPAAPQVVEATNPDEYGIFTSLDTPGQRATGEQGKRMFRKGFRTVSWRASDENDDDLRYTLSLRMKGESKWLRLRENLDATQMNFDTSQLPDGRYELRLTATDEADNPDGPLTDAKEGIEFVVDNTSPAIRATKNGSGINVRITDALSPIGRVEYAADAEKWIPITPVDGIADSREETFQLDAGEVDGRFVIIRAVDGQYNVATMNVE